MFTYSQKQEFRKNAIYIFFILLLAILSTHYIYDKFQNIQTINYNSESLDVIYREKTGDKITLSKVTPVTDSVGLSSKAYQLSVKNNLTEKVSYKIKVIDDDDFLMEDTEEDDFIPKEDIRISIKAGRINEIYDLSELKEGILLKDVLNALEVKNISIRSWVRQDSSIPSGSNKTYHGIIQVIEEDDQLAILS